jgi:UDP-N-acetylmuramyl pentapeptide phosphotransferase/UDP-N-acetylglucosamine-1-phosphate transferase
MSDLLIAFSAFVLSAFGVGVTLLYAGRAGIVDIPNQRSSHSVPTPRGGGIALVGSLLIVGGYQAVRTGAQPLWIDAILAAALLALMLLGWLDDHRSIRAEIRLPLHVLCALAIVPLVNSVAPIPSNLNVLWLTWWVFWAAASINIVNFMDGIDGMVACQGIVYGCFLFSVLPSEQFGAGFGIILAAACFGFLLWNWRPAKLFMGDVGSGPLGFAMVIGGALALERVGPSLIFLPLFPLYLDALVTLLLRVRRGEKLTEAHRSHLYQRAANAGLGHAVVSLTYALAAAIGALVAVAVVGAPSHIKAGAVSIYLIAVSGAWWFSHSRFAPLPLPER